jgi:hypothetical protein
VRNGRKISREENQKRDFQLPVASEAARSRKMYFEDKSEGMNGPARIGRVYFSKSGKSLYYQGKMFQRLKGSGFKANYFETETGAHFWNS